MPTGFPLKPSGHALASAASSDSIIRLLLPRSIQIFFVRFKHLMLEHYLVASTQNSPTATPPPSGPGSNATPPLRKQTERPQTLFAICPPAQEFLPVPVAEQFLASQPGVAAKSGSHKST